MNSFWQLIRPRVAMMVLFVTAAAAYTAGAEPPAWPLLLHTLVGTALVIVGAVSLNQLIERRSDAQMPRTASRPLPAGRLTPTQVRWFGLLISCLGAGYLALLTRWDVTATAVASWVIYVGLYTPLKQITPWQTAIGAVSGAMPMLIGAAAADSLLTPMAWALFGILYCWQLPHTMAIAWLYRDEYAVANVRVATVVDTSGRLAGWIAVVGGVAITIVSLVPVVVSDVGLAYAVIAALVGLVYLFFSCRFLQSRNEARARALLRYSLLYLPVVLVALVVAVWW